MTTRLDWFPPKRGLDQAQLQTAGNYKIIARCLYGRTRAVSCTVQLWIDKQHNFQAVQYINRAFTN